VSYLCSAGHRVKLPHGNMNADSWCPTCRLQRRERQWRQNPFFAGIYDGGPFYDLDGVSRIERAQRFNRYQCRRALLVKGLQKTVRIAIERRMRKLEAKA